MKLHWCTILKLSNVRLWYTTRGYASCAVFVLWSCLLGIGLLPVDFCKDQPSCKLDRWHHVASSHRIWGQRSASRSQSRSMSRANSRSMSRSLSRSQSRNMSRSMSRSMSKVGRSSSRALSFFSAGGSTVGEDRASGIELALKCNVSRISMFDLNPFPLAGQWWHHDGWWKVAIGLAN